MVREVKVEAKMGCQQAVLHAFAPFCAGLGMDPLVLDPVQLLERLLGAELPLQLPRHVLLHHRAAGAELGHDHSGLNAQQPASEHGDQRGDLPVHGQRVAKYAVALRHAAAACLLAD